MKIDRDKMLQALPVDVTPARMAEAACAEAERQMLLADCYGVMLERAEAAEARVAVLESALADAIECVEAWSAYASDYFKDKHDLAGDLARLRAAIRRDET